jgi:hypothetical protein
MRQKIKDTGGKNLQQRQQDGVQDFDFSQKCIMSHVSKNLHFITLNSSA